MQKKIDSKNNIESKNSICAPGKTVHNGYKPLKITLPHKIRALIYLCTYIHTNVTEKQLLPFGILSSLNKKPYPVIPTFVKSMSTYISIINQVVL